MTQSELGRDLVAAAVLRGSFVLRSGATSSYYIDKYLFTTRPDLLRRLAVELAARMPDGVQRVAGPVLGAVPLVTAVALAAGLPSVIVRTEKPKEYGTNKQIEGTLERGERVLLLEDIVTTGGAAMATLQALREAGAEVLSALAWSIARRAGPKRSRARACRFRRCSRGRHWACSQECGSRNPGCGAELGSLGRGANGDCFQLELVLDARHVQQAARPRAAWRVRTGVRSLANVIEAIHEIRA